MKAAARLIPVLDWSGRLRLAKPERDVLTWGVQLNLSVGPGSRSGESEFLTLNAGRVALWLVRNSRARRYLLRLRTENAAQVTIPRGGSAAEARRFAERNLAWLEREWQRLAARPAEPKAWRIGTQILFQGETVRIDPGGEGENGQIRFGDQALKVPDMSADLRPVVERYLWRLAARELPSRVMELAGLHRLPVRRVTVRNQRSRWGSCSRHRTVSLNWRLIQSPPFVRDYIIHHELMHLREMNHSARFWREVEQVCPDYQAAERWLKQHSALLR